MVIAAEGDALLHSEESVNLSQEEHLGSFTGNQLPSPSASLSEVPATEVQNIRSQRHVGIVLSLVHDLAHDSNSPRPRDPHGTCIQLQQSQLLGGVQYNDRGDEVAGFSPTLSAVDGTTQRTLHRRRPCSSHTKGNNKSRSVEVRSQRASNGHGPTGRQHLAKPTP